MAPFIQNYNERWLVAKPGHRSPAQARREYFVASAARISLCPGDRVQYIKNMPQMSATQRINTVTLWAILLLLLAIACRQALTPQRASAPGLDVVVLCSSCTLKGVPVEGHLILLDRTTGDVWVYSDESMEGAAPPIKWGKLILGSPVARNKY